MASIEFLTARIAKAEETISKKQNTIEKKQALIGKKIAKLAKMGISFTEETDKYQYRDNSEAFWTMCDIGTLKEDIRRGSKEIEEKQESLEKYQKDLEMELHKKNSRNIQIIIDFLEDWKKQNIEYYQKALPNFVKAYKEYASANRAYCDWQNSREGIEASKEERKARRAEDRDRRESFKMAWGWLSAYTDYKAIYKDGGYEREYFIDMNRLQKDLDQEADRKYDFIIERTKEIVTEITDATALHVHGGQLNGKIIGTTGSAWIETIGAGGYNIQRFHFRTLVKAL